MPYDAVNLDETAVNLCVIGDGRNNTAKSVLLRVGKEG
jgi:hypothetical protein